MTRSWSWLSPPLLLLSLLLAGTAWAQQQLLGQNSYEDNVKESVDVGGAPSGPDEINVQWTLTDTTISDQVTSYLIYWSGEDEGEDGSDSVDSSTTTYTIKSLVPCTTYTITVQPTADSGPLGDPGQTWTSTNSEGVMPVSNERVDKVSDNPHQLVVSWTLSVDIGRCPGYYKVTWNGTQTSEAEVQNTTRYNITGLDTWTLYHVCVDSGQDQDTLYNKFKCEDGRTDEDVPRGPPENIKTVTPTTDSLTVEWDPPATSNGVIASYSVTWSPDNGTADTTDTTYTITDLLPCTTYTITVSAATSKGYGPTGITSNIIQPAAPGPPTNVAVSMVENQSDSLTVSWTQAERPGRCEVTNNTVTWWMSSTGALVDSVTVDPTDHYTISGLDPWSTYLVCVRAANQGGDGPDAPCLNHTTDEDIPGPPQNVSVSGTTAAESITVEWDPPAAPNGVITNYLITWSPDDSTADTTNTTYIITDLLLCTTYTVTVSAATSKGHGPSGDTSDTTQPAVPGPPTNVAVHMVEDQSDSLTVSWTQAERLDRCDVTNNTVTWWLSSTGALMDSVTVDPTDHYTISGLDPWSTYLVCVRAANQGGDGPDAPCLNQTTGEDIPGPPQNVRVSGTTAAESITVEWDPPAAPNGVITNYLVTWSPDDSTADTTDTTYIITDLLPCTTYIVTISAATSKGYGPSGDNSDTTQTAVPGPPTNMAVDMVEDQSDSLTVSWIQPDASCDITNNIVTWWLSSTGAPVDNVTVDPTDHYTISGLDPWTNYLVCVRAATLGGDGPDAPCLNQNTDEDIPGGPPENIKVVTSTTDSLAVEWDPPVAPNGVITSYLVTWSPDNGTADTTDTTYNLTGLLPCTTYTVTISAATSKGYGSSVDTPGTTQPSAPGQPTNLTVDMVEDQSGSLTVSWTQPDTRCDIINNTITWWLSSTGDLVDSVTVNPTDHYTISGLDSWTTYLVCVKAATLGGDGSDAPCPKQTTDVGQLSIYLVPSPTSIEVHWSLVTTADSYIIVWSIKANGGWSTVDNETNQYIIADLQPCTNYSIYVEARRGENHLKMENNSTLTLPHAPQSVTNLDVTQVDRESALEISWSAVMPPGNCDLTYRVTWSRTNGTEVGSKTTSDPIYTIRNLSHGTMYTVCVDPWVEGQNASQVCDQETTIASRLALHLEATSRTITVYWTKNDTDVSYWLVWFCNMNESGANIADNETDSFVIRDLQPCSNCTIYLDARNGSQEVEKDVDSIRTLAIAPHPVANLNVTQVGSEPALKVSWSPVTLPGNCDLTYRVTWSFSNGTESGIKTTSDPFYTIRDLFYGTKYTVCVDHWTEGKNAGQLCKQTKIDSKLVLHLEATSTTIYAQWTKDGSADSYIVLWNDEWNANAWCPVEGGVDNFVIENLQPDSNYTVIVDARKGSQEVERDVDSIKTLKVSI